MSDGGDPFPEVLQRVPLVVHEATRSLLWLRSPRDARRTAIDLVRALGGEVAPGGTADPAIVPVDISFGEGDPLLPSAPPGSGARSLLDRYLSPFVLDARRALDVVERAERLAASASTDPLTGLLNRRMLDRALGRLGDDETVIIIDLDHFKQVNDERGHGAGDDVLRAFGAVLRDNLRERDLVGRYGGEEFVLVIAPPSQAEAVLERLRDEWIANRPQPVTFSAGIAGFAGDATSTLRAADQALYRAKDAGRDRWLWAEGRSPASRAPLDHVEPHLHVAAYLDQAIVGNRQPAVRLALDLVEGGVAEERIVEDLLAAAQREVGERWYRNEISPADEHLASGVAGAALDALSAEMSPPSRNGLVVVACAEGDWHSLSAQMFGEALRALGSDVTVLGASSPAAAVADFVERAGGDVLAVSCNLPIFFPGAVSLINAAHAMGVPVIVGGRAFGDDGRRAATLGADAWAPDAAGASLVLAEWAARPPAIRREPVELDADALRLFRHSSGLATTGLEGLRAAFPPMAAYDARQLARTHEDLVFIVQFLAAAILAADDTVFTSFLVWLRELLRTRGVPTSAIAAGLRALHPAVEAVAPGAARLLTSDLHVLDSPSDSSEPAQVDCA